VRELRDLAAKLLADGAVKVVIGWEEGPRGLRPAFVTTAADAERLVFDARAVHNLAAYLNPRRAQVKRLGKPAVVVKGCDAVAAAALVRESQRRREDFVLIGVRCGGVFAGPEGKAAALPHTSGNSVAGAGLDDPCGARLQPCGTSLQPCGTLAPRCVGCQRSEPAFCDYLVGPPSPLGGFGAAGQPADAAIGLNAAVDRIEAMTLAERWAFWTGEFERCVRCYACRQACPVCFCERCVAEKTVPQWIESSPHGRGNLAWHLTRALHQAGRCTGCGECERACPAGIPLSLINRKLERAVAARFGAVASDDPAAPAPVGAFTLDDPQEFIL
jgi:ferredoxin